MKKTKMLCDQQMPLEVSVKENAYEGTKCELSFQAFS